MIYNMTAKGQVKKLTIGQGHVLAQTYHLYIFRFVSLRQTCFEACISSQSKVIAMKLLVTYDDVTRPPLLIAEVSGAPVNLNGW